MRLIVEAAIGSIIISIVLPLFAYAASWPIEATTRVLAVALALWWTLIFAYQWFITHNHALGQAELRRMVRWILPDEVESKEATVVEQPAQLPAPLPRPPIEAPSVDRLLMVNKAPAPAEIELPNGVRLPREDLLFFVEHLDSKGHTRAAWEKTKMPSGKIVDGTYLKKLMDAVAVSGEFPTRGQGVKAQRRLTTAEIKKRLSL